MSAEEFTAQFIAAFGDWDDDETGRSLKKRFVEFVRENYHKEELDDLWRLVEKTIERRPSNPIAAINKLMPGKSVRRTGVRMKDPEYYGFGEVEFTTPAGKRFGDQLTPIFAVKITGDSTQDDFLTDEQRATMRSRASSFFDILFKLMREPKGGRG